jgi:hypothetical protein
MVLECWIIILILAIAGYMFIRGHKRMWAPGVLPLMLLPLANIIYHPIGMRIAESSGGAAAAGTARLVIYMLSLAAASVWVVIFSRRLPTGRSKYTYVISSIAFTALLVVIFTVKVTYAL